MKNVRLTKTIGIFLSITFSILFFNNLYFYLFRETNVSLLMFLQYNVLIGIVAIILIHSTVRLSKITPVIHVIILLLIGFGTIVSTTRWNDVHGEMIVILALLTARSYGLKVKSFKRLYITLFLICIAIKYVFAVFNVVGYNHFFSYLILLLFLNLFFFVILTSEEEKIKEEARKICHSWSKEQIYFDVGKSVFSTFVHDYNINDTIVTAEMIEELIAQKKYDKAASLASNLSHMLSEYSRKSKSIRRKVALSLRKNIEETHIADFVKRKIDEYSFFLEANNCSLILKNDLDRDVYVKIVPIDLSGILDSLFKNAIEATVNKQIVTVLSCNARRVFIEIFNDGKKIPWANKDGSVNLEDFRPGRTTKDEGTGWGVYTSLQRITENRGQLKVKSTKDETVFIVSFPKCRQEVINK